ncbi:methylamine utilization protein MauJ [Pseudomonas monteilii]|uniref:methylamine utilization protein MauJ n=1 Tax=Pseudomonas monteilii TaxID=76759 RepID=UPI003D074271
MKTPYVLHIFGDEVKLKLTSRRGWLTAGVASSIAWPSLDVCVLYAVDEYFLRGTSLGGKPSPPGITIACDASNPDEAITKVYRFTSVLSWFLGGYVDVSGYIYGSHANLYGTPRTVFSSLGLAGSRSFNCNHMPVVDQEHVRKALAFWREGKRLDEVHDSYAFLSFYKVIESQFSDAKKKVAWIKKNIDKLTDRAAKRVSELSSDGVDVSRHLYESGRCAVAHASLEGEIVDPDIPSDRRRLSSDLVIMEELARIYIRDELKVPDVHTLYRSRNRLSPWSSLLPKSSVDALNRGLTPESVDGLQGQMVTVGLWPTGPIAGLEEMTMHVDTVHQGVVKIVLINQQKTILLVFFLDFRSGRAHTNLEDGGLLYGDISPSEEHVRAYATFFYKVLGNGVVELGVEGLEPVDCDVVIPVNIMPPDPDRAIEEQVEKFRRENGWDGV